MPHVTIINRLDVSGPLVAGKRSCRLWIDLALYAMVELGWGAWAPALLEVCDGTGVSFSAG